LSGDKARLASGLAPGGRYRKFESNIDRVTLEPSGVGEISNVGDGNVVGELSGIGVRVELGTPVTCAGAPIFCSVGGIAC
jgi:CheY-specific phosphatase CheX